MNRSVSSSKAFILLAFCLSCAKESGGASEEDLSIYTRTSLPSSLAADVPAAISPSTINTASATSISLSGNLAQPAGEISKVMLSQIPPQANSGSICQNVSQTGQSSISNNRVAIGCELIGNVTDLLGFNILMGELFMNVVDAKIADGTVTASGSCGTASGTLTKPMINSMKATAAKIGMNAKATENLDAAAGQSVGFAYQYSTTGIDADYSAQLKVSKDCTSLGTGADTTTYLWNNSSGLLSVGFTDSSSSKRIGVFTYDPAAKRSTYRVKEEEQVTDPGGGISDNTNNYTVTIKECNDTEKDSTSGACAVLKINLAIIQQGTFPADYGSGYSNAPKTGYAIYKAEGKADDSGVYIEGTFKDFAYANNDKTDVPSGTKHVWVFEGSWNTSGLTYVKLTQDGVLQGTYPSTGTAPVIYDQTSYAAAAKSASVTLSGGGAINNTKIGSFVIMKDSTSTPTAAPQAIIGTAEIGYSNASNTDVEATTDAWAVPTSAKSYWWNPQTKAFVASDIVVTVN